MKRFAYLSGLLLLGIASNVWADGLIVPVRPDIQVRGHWAVKYHKVDIKVRVGVDVTWDRPRDGKLVHTCQDGCEGRARGENGLVRPGILVAEADPAWRKRGRSRIVNGDRQSRPVRREILTENPDLEEHARGTAGPLDVAILERRKLCI